MDEEQAKALAYQMAAAEYDSQSSGEYETEWIQRMLRRTDLSNKADLLRNCVERVYMADGKVSFLLRSCSLLPCIHR